jgi:xylan 1,4-beta-xylosidase
MMKLLFCLCFFCERYYKKDVSVMLFKILVLSSLFFNFSLFAQNNSDERWFPKVNKNEYVNPVISGFFPDPSVVRVGEDYYCVNSTFEYFPGIIISHSKDLINWKQIGHVFTKRENLDLDHFFDAMGIWAPDISYHNGEYYIFYCTVQLSKDRSTNVRGNYMTKSKNILGPWSKPIQLTENGNDPSHFVDDNGDHYMLYAAGIPTGNGTKIARLNKECSKIIDGPYWLETEGKKAAPEGPHLFKNNGYYYLTMAASGGLFNGHHMLLARSANILGPYINSPYNPYLTQENAQGINFHQGHGKIFKSQNNEWFTMVLSQRWLSGNLHGKPAAKGISPLGRKTSLIRLEWSADAWIKETASRQPLDIYNKPNLTESKVYNITSDEFNKGSVGLPWQFRRNPDSANFSLSEKLGFLRIYTGNYDINNINGKNLIVQRERWLKFTATTKMIFNPINQEQAGLTCYYDTKTYVRLGLGKNEDGKMQLVLEEMQGGKAHINKIISGIKNKPIYLKVVVDKLKRAFYYSYNNKKWEPVGFIEESSYLSDQGTPNWGFMGTMVGIYAFNRGTGKHLPADFDFFRIQALEN